MRILPAYLLVIFVFSLVTWLYNGGPLNRTNLLLNLFFIHPFFFFRNDVGPDFIPGTWSLVTEVHFYLILPVMARFFLSLGRGIFTAISFVALSFFYRAFVATHITALGASWSVSFILGHNILAHIDQFGLGMLAALIYVNKIERGWNISPLVPPMLLIFGVLAYWLTFSGSLPFIKDYETVWGLSFSMVVLGVVAGPSPVRRLMEWGPLRIVGLISYSMFLINVVLAVYLLAPLMNMFLIKEPLQRFAFNMTAGVVILFVVSLLSYLFIEKPFLTNNPRGATAHLCAGCQEGGNG